VSAVTLGESQSGIERVRKHDTDKADEIESWLDQLAQSDQVLPINAHCFREWGRLMHEKPNRSQNCGETAWS
jgi:predicted nucleic acid-binding protein